MQICRQDSCILLDVGEGTCGQIYRFYGDEAPKVIAKIKAIYVSHMHADHHIGKYVGTFAHVFYCEQRKLGNFIQNRPISKGVSTTHSFWEKKNYYSL